jgi:hypothetical protein
LESYLSLPISLGTGPKSRLRSKDLLSNYSTNLVYQTTPSKLNSPGGTLPFKKFLPMHTWISDLHLLRFSGIGSKNPFSITTNISSWSLAHTSSMVKWPLQSSDRGNSLVMFFSIIAEVGARHRTSWWHRGEDLEVVKRDSSPWAPRCGGIGHRRREEWSPVREPEGRREGAKRSERYFWYLKILWFCNVGK